MIGGRRENAIEHRLSFAQSFCSRCGSAAPRVDRDRGIVIIPMGAFDDDPPQRPQEHIFAGSKASWFDIPGPLPQHDERPTG
jgi:hypothetical protein